MEISSYDDKYLLKGKLRLTDMATSDDGEAEFEVGVSDKAVIEIDEETQVDIGNMKEAQVDISKISLVKENASGFPTYVPSGPQGNTS